MSVYHVHILPSAQLPTCPEIKRYRMAPRVCPASTCIPSWSLQASFQTMGWRQRLDGTGSHLPWKDVREAATWQRVKPNVPLLFLTFSSEGGWREVACQWILAAAQHKMSALKFGLGISTVLRTKSGD